MRQLRRVRPAADRAAPTPACACRGTRRRPPCLPATRERRRCARRCPRSPARRSGGARRRGSAPCTRACACGPASSSAPSNSLTRAVELRRRDDVVHEPDPIGLRRVEALGGQEIAARVPRADRLDRRTGEIVAGMRPSFASDSANVASCAAIAMSQHATRPTPPPIRRAVHARDRRLRHAVRASRSIAASACASARFSARA